MDDSSDISLSSFVTGRAENRMEKAVPPIYIWQRYNRSGRTDYIPPLQRICHVNELVSLHRIFESIGLLSNHNQRTAVRRYICEGAPRQRHGNEAVAMRRHGNEAAPRRRHGNDVRSLRSRGTQSGCDVRVREAEDRLGHNLGTPARRVLHEAIPRRRPINRVVTRPREINEALTTQRDVNETITTQYSRNQDASIRRDVTRGRRNHSASFRRVLREARPRRYPINRAVSRPRELNEALTRRYRRNQSAVVNRDVNEATTTRRDVNEAITTQRRRNQATLTLRDVTRRRRNHGTSARRNVSEEATATRRDVNESVITRCRNQGTSAQRDVNNAARTRSRHNQNALARRRHKPTSAMLMHHHFTYYHPDQSHPFNNIATQSDSLPGPNEQRRLYYSYSISANLGKTDHGWFSSRNTYCVSDDEVKYLEEEVNEYYSGEKPSLDTVTPKQKATPVFQFLQKIMDGTNDSDRDEEDLNEVVEESDENEEESDEENCDEDKENSENEVDEEFDKDEENSDEDEENSENEVEEESDEEDLGEDRGDVVDDEEICRGLCQADINEIGSIKYRSHVIGSSSSERCSVCLADYQEGDDLRHLSCGHIFHKHCMDQWLRNDIRCPVCRNNLQKRFYL